MCPRKQKNVVLVRIIGESMIQIGDLVRIRPDETTGVWLVVQIDSWSWVCQVIQGNKKEWFDINHVEVVTHD